MTFYLHEIDRGQIGEGQTLTGAIGDAMIRATAENRLTETFLPVGRYDLSRPWLPQKISLNVRTSDEAILSRVSPFIELTRIGTMALMGNGLYLAILPPQDGDPTRPFIEPIYAAIDAAAETERWRVNLYMSVIYHPPEGG